VRLHEREREKERKRNRFHKVDIGPRNIPEEKKAKLHCTLRDTSSEIKVISEKTSRDEDECCTRSCNLARREKKRSLRDAQKSPQLSGDWKIPDIVIADPETSSGHSSGFPRLAACIMGLAEDFRGSSRSARLTDKLANWRFRRTTWIQDRYLPTAPAVRPIPLD